MKRAKQIALGVLVLITGLWLWDVFSPEPPIDDVQLREDEAIRVDVTDNKVQVVTKYGSNTHYLPSSGRETITVKNDGTLDITRKNKGLSLEAGLGVGYDIVPRATLDCQVFFWNRFGTHLGVGLANAHPALVPFVSLSYRLSQFRLQNSSVYVGMTARKDPIFGVRVEL
jgi:hypothetical protein